MVSISEKSDIQDLKNEMAKKAKSFETEDLVLLQVFIKICNNPYLFKSLTYLCSKILEDRRGLQIILLILHLYSRYSK